MSKEKVINTINEITNRYHFTAVDGEFNGRHFPNNLVFTTLSYLTDGNHVLIGDPGWGKTTLAQLVSTKFSGIPFDLYESLTVEGHPGAFTEKWKARPHYGALAKAGEEKVIWQGSFGLDTFIVDEVNRVTADVQDEMLEGIRTGRWKYLNDVIYEGKKPVFFTMNDRDDGNGDVIPPLKDRIDIVTEQSAEGPLYDYRNAAKCIREDLSSPEATTEALDALSQINFARFKDIVHKSRKGDYLTHDEKQKIQEEIIAIPFTNDANYFLWTFACEINFNYRYGKKRRQDPLSEESHDKNYAGVHVKNSFSPRPQTAAETYARGLAWILGHDKVELDHVRYVLPFITAHKLQFTKDFRDHCAKNLRTDCEDLHVAKELVKIVHGNYEKSIKPLRNVIARIQQGKANPSEVKLDEHDHPLLRYIIQKKILEPKCNL